MRMRNAARGLALVLAAVLLLGALPMRAAAAETPAVEPTAEPTATPVPVPEPMFFYDVEQDAWYYHYVWEAWRAGLMEGTDPHMFEPNSTTLRCQFAMVIYRLAGKPEVPEAELYTCPFRDLDAKWYREAVVWCYREGVVNGVNNFTFDPYGKITREQMVTMLFRYDADKSGSVDLSCFKDSAKISAYARDAVSWSAANGIILGMEDGTFRPQGNATRAQLAAVLLRYSNLDK